MQPQSASDIQMHRIPGGSERTKGVFISLFFFVRCLCLSSDDTLASHSNRKRSPATLADSNAKHDPNKTEDASQRQLEAVHNRETDYPILESCEKSDILQEALAGVTIFVTSQVAVLMSIRRPGHSEDEL
jgi:hypothetical protein